MRASVCPTQSVVRTVHRLKIRVVPTVDRFEEGQRRPCYETRRGVERPLRAFFGCRQIPARPVDYIE